MATNKKSKKFNQKRPSFTKGVLGKTEYKKIGNYMESTGGGTPLPKGHKLKDHPEAVRVDQPRDEEGRFTYNSMNRKTRKFKYHAKKKVIVNGKEKWVKKTKEEMSIPPALRNVNFEGALKRKDRIIFQGDIYIAGEDITKEEFLDMYREYKVKVGEKLRKEVGKYGGTTYRGKDDSGFGELANRELGRKIGRQKSKAEKQVTKNIKEGVIEKDVQDKTRENRKEYRHSYYNRTGK